MVWTNCSQDAAMGLELFNVVKSISSAISAAKLTFFIDMLAMKPTKMISGEDTAAS